MLLKSLNLHLGSKCNGNCKYCFRKYNKQTFSDVKLTKEFAEYLRLNAVKYRRIVFVGGESLLYLAEIKQICNLVPKYVSKRIITNGKLLTKDIVDYCNDNNIDISISYDGETSAQNRGYDIFDMKQDLIRDIKSLTISSVISADNLDISKVYFDIKNKLGGREFNHIINTYLDDGSYTNHFSVDFDYKLFRKYLVEYQVNAPEQFNQLKLVKGDDEIYGTAILLNGDVVSMLTLKKYGTIFDNEDTLLNSIKQDYKKCVNCEFSNECHAKRQFANKHFCSTMKVILEAQNYMRNKQ